jgi:integrase
MLIGASTWLHARGDWREAEFKLDVLFTERASRRTLKTATPSTVSAGRRMRSRKNVRIGARVETTSTGRDREQEPIKYLTKVEVERFFRAIPKALTRDLLLFDLVYRHGLRRSEAARLTVEDLRDGKIWVARRKHGRSNAYPLHPRSRRLLARYLRERGGDSPYLFPGRAGDAPMSGGEIHRRFHIYAAAAGLPKDRSHPHSLRHAVGVHLANAGWDVSDVQDWLGHRDISSTLIYFRITNKRREERYRATLRSRAIARTDGQE